MNNFREVHKVDASECNIKYVHNKNFYRRILEGFEKHKQKRLIFKIFGIGMEEWYELKELLIKSGAKVSHDYFINDGECLSAVIGLEESMLYKYRHFLNINIYAGKTIYFITLFITLMINVSAMDNPTVFGYNFLIIAIMVANIAGLGSIIHKMNFNYNGFQTNFLDVYGDDKYWQGKVLKFRKTLISNTTNVYIPVIVMASLFLIMAIAVS